MSLRKPLIRRRWVSTAPAAKARRAPSLRTVRHVTALGLLAITLSTLAGVGALAPAALAAGPQITVTCTTPTGCSVSGTGFTPSAQLHVESYVGSALLSSSSVTASAPTVACVYGLKPICHPIGGGDFYLLLPVDHSLACNANAAGTPVRRDSPAPTHASASNGASGRLFGFVSEPGQPAFRLIDRRATEVASLATDVAGIHGPASGQVGSLERAASGGIRARGTIMKSLRPIGPRP